MTFLQDSIDLFAGARGSHMGSHQYVPHKGVRLGKPTSGDLLWAEAEAQRITANGSMLNSEAILLQAVAKEIGDYLPHGLTVIDLGPGTVQAFKSKVLPLIQALQSNVYIPVDESTGFLREITNAKDLEKNLQIRPIVDNFFDSNLNYCDGKALVCSFGATISNIENPVSDTLPEAALVQGLLHLAAAAHQGALLVAFDSNQNGEAVKAYYKQHGVFQTNIFDRMAVELPVKNFDALAFDYEPLWIPASGQLAHMAVVNRDIDFSIGGKDISLKKEQRLHLKNSYKFTPEFFERACRIAGLKTIRAWADNSNSKAYLLELPPHVELHRSNLLADGYRQVFNLA